MSDDKKPTTLVDDRPPTMADSPSARATSYATPFIQPEAAADESEAFAERYEVREKLGEGGMGEVLLYADQRIGREIAMKVLRQTRASQADARRRFLREARVQGQLEHPSIVPVYDLGRDPGGHPFFTMKRVRGRTLEQVFEDLRWDDEATMREWTRHKLLTAFGNVCLAVHFAHARGVLHRDLKPDNVMLGDFGEVYVLDWGLAKVMSETSGSPISERERAVTPDAFLDQATPGTAHGAVMGTPGYMAPEQIHGDVESLDPRTDVYALGAILFEILTFDPLHKKGSSGDLMKATLLGSDARASLRAPKKEIAPELDAICVKATALDAKDRFPTARALYEALEAFLSGDRDVERRRELARDHAKAATLAADNAIAGGPGATAERTRAMREVSRAVALDPENADAMKTLVRLFTELPRELPREAREDLAKALATSQRAGARSAAYGYLSWIAYAPLVLWMGVRELGWGLFCDVLFAASAAASFAVARSSPGRLLRATDVALFVSTLSLICATGVVGPFVLMPGVAVINTILYVATADRSRRAPAIVLGCMAIAVPFALTLFGVLPSPYAFKDGAFITLPQIASLPAVPTLTFLLLSSLAVIVTAALIVGQARDALYATQERLYLHTWQLRQLVPGDAYGVVAVPPVA